MKHTAQMKDVCPEDLVQEEKTKEKGMSRWKKRTELGACGVSVCGGKL